MIVITSTTLEMADNFFFLKTHIIRVRKISGLKKTYNNSNLNQTIMKSFTGTIQFNNTYYKDTIIARWKWIARIILKKRNSGKLIEITTN